MSEPTTARRNTMRPMPELEVTKVPTDEYWRDNVNPNRDDCCDLRK